MKKNFQDR